jgi:hypothetical protein
MNASQAIAMTSRESPKLSKEASIYHPYPLHIRPDSVYSIVDMSRKGGQPGFATKSMFDVLQNDEQEEEEVEEEDVALDQVIE